MCTVTFLPTESGFILTSNRDEAPKRQDDRFPEFKKHKERIILYPKEPLAGGTWIAASDHGLAACLLNGGFSNHKHNPPYRLSRGRMMLELMEYDDPVDFFSHYSFEGIEPFTLVVIDYTSNLKGHVLVWDGRHTHLEKLDCNKPRIWASSTLYDESIKRDRQKKFRNWLKQHPHDNQNEIIKFHSSGSAQKGENTIVMDRGIVKTLSTTSIEFNTHSMRAFHKRLSSHSQRNVILPRQVPQ